MFNPKNKSIPQKEVLTARKQLNEGVEKELEIHTSNLKPKFKSVV